jgi:hypothetical protein
MGILHVVMSDAGPKMCLRPPKLRANRGHDQADVVVLVLEV